MADLNQEDSWIDALSTFKNVCLEFDEKCFKRKRVVDTLMLVIMLLKMVSSKSRQGYATIISDFWISAKEIFPKLTVVKPIAQSSFSNARNKLDPEVFQCINRSILAKKSTKKYRWKGLRILSIDGSKINLPRNLLTEGFKLSNPQSYYPQGVVSCAYDLIAKVPVDFKLDETRNERACAMDHLQKLNKGDLVVYDRGYQSFSLMFMHFKLGIDFVMRMETTTTFNAVKEFANSKSYDQIVELVPAEGSLTKIRRSCPEVEFSGLKVRLIKYKVEKKEYILATSLLDKKKFLRKDFPDIYHSRWGVEEMYKSLKSSLSIEFQGKTRRKVEQELFAGFLLMTISRLFTNTTTPSETSNKTKKKLSGQFQTWHTLSC